VHTDELRRAQELSKAFATSARRVARVSERAAGPLSFGTRRRLKSRVIPGSRANASEIDS